MAVRSLIPAAQRGGPQHGQMPDRGAPTGQHYSIENVTNEDDLATLREDWNRLTEAAESANVFTTYDWFRAWNQRLAQEYGGGLRGLHVLVLKKGGAVAGIAPLIHRSTSRLGFIVRKVEFLEFPADYNDFVWGNDLAGQSEAIVDFFARTRDQWDLVDLRDLPETGSTLAAMKSALSHAGLIYRILPEEDRCPYLKIDGPWSAMIKRLGQRTRGDLRTKQHRLERLHTEGLRVRIIENPQDEPGLLEKLIALEGQKLVNGKLMPPFVRRYPEVFQSLFNTLGPRGWFYVTLMELGDRLLACQIGFRRGKKLWAFLTAYDHSFSRLSPGTMLMPALLDYGFSHGFEEFDFLRGEEPYKMAWSTGFHERFRLAIWSRRWISRTRAFVYLDVKSRVYRLLGRGK